MQTHQRNNNQQSQQRLSGMPCPECSGFIPISMYQLLSLNPIFCPYCGLKLEINKTASERALDALKKVEEAEKEVKKRSNFNGNV